MYVDHLFDCAIQCFADDMIVPSSTQEVATAVSFYYNKTRHGQPVTLRVSRPMFHSSQNFPCPNSPLKPPAISQNIPPAERRPTEKTSTAMPMSVGVMSTKLNKILAKDYNKWTMRVQPGMRYTEFLAQAEKAGMSVQIGTPTAYAGLTLGGVLATTSHGSGDQTTSAIWHTLLEIVWVDGTGKVHVSKREDPELKAMVGGLGVLGVMTEFVMQMTPKSATTLITVRRNDTNMMKDINELLKVNMSSHRGPLLNLRPAQLCERTAGSMLPSSTCSCSYNRYSSGALIVCRCAVVTLLTCCLLH